MPTLLRPGLSVLVAALAIIACGAPINVLPRGDGGAPPTSPSP